MVLPAFLKRRTTWFEVAVVLAIMAAALPAGLYAVDHSPLPSGNYHGFAPEWFLPSALLAAGHGFSFPEQFTEDGALGGFIRQERSTLAPAQIPDTLRTTPAKGPPALHRYLCYTIAAVWWAAGISWSALKLLSVALYIAIVLLVYILFRLAGPRVLAAAGAVVFACHTVLLEELLIFREISKAAFFLATFCLFARLLQGQRSYRRLLGAAALTGALIGVGIGFRYDVIVCLPPALLLVATAQWPDAGWAAWKRLAAVLLLLAAFFACGFPILDTESSRGTHDHIVGGFAPDIEARMNLEPASYRRIQMNEDRLTFAMMNHYARHIMGRAAHVPFLSTEGDEPGQRYLLTLLTTFPADMLTRGYASTLTILQETPARYEAPDIRIAGLVHTLMRPLDHHLACFGPLYAALAVLVLALRRPRAGWLLLVLILYFGAYPSLQFFPRHYFHLTFFSLWCVVFLVCAGVRFLRGAAASLGGGTGEEAPAAPAATVYVHKARRLVIFAGGAALLLCAPLYAARAYQYVKVQSVIDDLDNAPLARVPVYETAYTGTATVEPASTMTLFRVKKKTDLSQVDAETNQPYIHTRYLVAFFAPQAHQVNMLVKYTNETWAPGFTHSVPVEPHKPPGPVKVFFPVHEFPEALSISLGANTFEGIVLPKENAAAFQGLYEVTDLSRYPMLLELTLAPGGRGFQWRQRLEWCPEK